MSKGGYNCSTNRITVRNTDNNKAAFVFNDLSFVSLDGLCPPEFRVKLNRKYSRLSIKNQEEQTP